MCESRVKNTSAAISSIKLHTVTQLARSPWGAWRGQEPATESDVTFTPALLGCALSSAAVTVVLVVSGHEVGALILLIATVAFALADQKRTVIANFPLAFLLVLFTTIVTYSAAAYLGKSLFSSAPAARGLLVGMTCVSTICIVARRRSLGSTRIASRAKYSRMHPRGCSRPIRSCHRTPPRCSRGELVPVEILPAFPVARRASNSRGILITALRLPPRLAHRCRHSHERIGTIGGQSSVPHAFHQDLFACDVVPLRPSGARDGLVHRQRLEPLDLERNRLVAAGALGPNMLTGAFFTFTMAMGFQTSHSSCPCSDYRCHRVHGAQLRPHGS